MGREVSDLANCIHVVGKSNRKRLEDFVELVGEVSLLRAAFRRQDYLQAPTRQRGRGLLASRKHGHGLAKVCGKRGGVRLNLNRNGPISGAAGANLGLWMRTIIGVGTPRGLQGRLAAALAALRSLWQLIRATVTTPRGPLLIARPRMLSRSRLG
jgi:hypothetical protein